MYDSVKQAQVRFRGLAAALQRPLCICRATTRANSIVPLESLIQALRYVEPAAGGQQIEIDIDGRRGILESFNFTFLGSSQAIDWATIEADNWPGLSGADPQKAAEINTFLPFRLMQFIEDFNFLELCFATSNDPADEIKDLFASSSLLKAAIFIPLDNNKQDLDRFQIYSDVFKVFVLPNQFISNIKRKDTEETRETQQDYKIFNEKSVLQLSNQSVCTLNVVFKEIVNLYIAALKKSLSDCALAYRVAIKQTKFKNLVEHQQQIVQHLQNNYGETILLRYAKLLIFHFKAKDNLTDFVVQILTDFLTKFNKTNVQSSNVAFYLRALICINNYIDCDDDDTKTEFRSGIVFQIFYDTKSLLLQTNNELSLLKKKYKGNWATNISILNKPLVEVFSSEVVNIFNMAYQDVAGKYHFTRSLNFKIFAEILYVIIFGHMYQQGHLPRQIQSQNTIEACQDLIHLLTKKDIPETCFLKQIYFINAYFWLKEYNRQKIKQCLLLGMQIWQSMIKNVQQKSNKNTLTITYIKLIENFGKYVKMPNTFTKLDPVYQLYINCKLQTQLLAYQHIESYKQSFMQYDKKIKQSMHDLIREYLYENKITENDGTEYCEEKLIRDFIMKSGSKILLQNIIPFLNCVDVNLFTVTDIQLARDGIIQDFSEIDLGNELIAFDIYKMTDNQKYLYFGYNYIVLEEQDLPLINSFARNSHLELEPPYHERFKFPDQYKSFQDLHKCKIEHSGDQTINKIINHGISLKYIKYYTNDMLQIVCEVKTNFQKSFNLQVNQIEAEFNYYNGLEDCDGQDQKTVQNHAFRLIKQTNSILSSQTKKFAIQIKIAEILTFVNQKHQKMLFSLKNLKFHASQNNCNTHFCIPTSLNFSVLNQKAPEIDVEILQNSPQQSTSLSQFQIKTQEQELKMLVAEWFGVRNNIESINNNEAVQNQPQNIIKSQIELFQNVENQLQFLTAQNEFLSAEIQRPLIILRFYEMLQIQMLERHGFGFLQRRKSINNLVYGQSEFLKESKLQNKQNLYISIQQQIKCHYNTTDVKKARQIYFVDENGIMHRRNINAPKILKQSDNTLESQSFGKNSLLFIKTIQNIHKFKYNLAKKEEIAQIFFISEYLIDYTINVLNNKIILIQENEISEKEGDAILNTQNQITYFLNNLPINLCNYNITRLYNNQQYDDILQLSNIFEDTSLEYIKLQRNIRETADFLCQTHNTAYQDSKDSENFIKRAKIKFEKDLQKIQSQFVTSCLEKQRYGYLVVVTNNSNIMTKSIKLPMLQQYKIEQKYIQTQRINIKTFTIRNILSIYNPIFVNISNQKVTVNFGETKYIEVVETQADEHQN